MDSTQASNNVTLTSFIPWGTRGHVPQSATSAIYCGIHTACVEVRLSDGRSLVFDAGSGIGQLGRRLEQRGVELLNVFLTHLHLGHIQGLCQLPLLSNPNATIRIYGPGTPADLENTLMMLFSPPFTSVPWSQWPARRLYGSIEHGAIWEEGGVQIEAFRTRHPGEAYGFRVQAGDRALVYMPDNEIVGGNYPTHSTWYDDLVDFIRGADVLIHDAVWLEEEYPSRRGMGHSTIEQAIALAEDAEVAHLYLFHHESHRTDRDLIGQLRSLQMDLAASGSELTIEIAREGWEVRFDGGLGPQRPATS